MKCPPPQRFVCRLLIVAAVFAGGSVRSAPGDEFWDNQIGTNGIEGVSIYAVAVFRGEAYVGGIFTSIGGILATNIARWNGSNWSGIGSLSGGMYAGVGVLTASADALYAAGIFNNASGVPATNIAKWDGTNWSPLGVGIDAPMFALATSGADLYVGGSFFSAGGILASNIVRWDGTNWWPLKDGVEGAVFSIATQENEVYVGGGSFTLASGVAATNVAKWDGSNWSPLGNGLRNSNGGSGVNGQVHALTIHDNKLFAGGNFNLAGAVNAPNMAMWDGTNWSNFGNGASGTIESIVRNGNDLFVGGSFLQVGGLPIRTVAKWDGMTWAGLGSGLFNGSPLAMAATGSELYIVGDFKVAGTTLSTRVAQWHIPHPLSVAREGGSVALSWPATGTNFMLEARESVADTNWTVVSTNPAVVGDQCRVTNQINSPSRFFRLRRK